MTSSAYDMPFQRNSNIYWTLQPRQQKAAAATQRYQTSDAYQTKDDNIQNFESLYSTPNKHRNNLRTTAMGFDFFSPVPNAKLNERILEESGIDENDEKNMSPIDPRNVGGFQTSTPQKSTITMSPMKSSLTEDLRARLKISNSGIRSHGNSPINSGRSTPKGIFEPQHSSRTRHSWSANNVEVPSSTCSDRLGTPKTSLMDFKKLLLNKNSSTNRVGKISAVEQLKMSKTAISKLPTTVTAGSPIGNQSTMNILDLSGSPKTFATRRMIRQGQFGQSIANSPTKPGAKQKHTWRMQNMRTDVISTAIPEAANDEEVDNSPNASQLSRKSNEIIKSPEIVIREAEDEGNGEEMEQLVGSIKENLFIKQEENNFTENEIRENKKLVPHHINQQQQRAQFLFGIGTPATVSTTSPLLSVQSNNNKTAIFKNGGHYGGIVTSSNSGNSVQNKDNNGTMKANGSTVPPASLETAL
ncbi:hypothetical protein PVAND_002232 [Polypedilum vanderplanki]|uniref:Uncharacterized protein n=1 Tax=Polypedilum vanderplanki TaxID=319348 RepID=A0A9J6BQC7_POLVA|nr:hypothetical protein PVAND_002232 [Polypedilum vanderplanki]